MSPADAQHIGTTTALFAVMSFLAGVFLVSLMVRERAGVANAIVAFMVGFVVSYAVMASVVLYFQMADHMPESLTGDLLAFRARDLQVALVAPLLGIWFGRRARLKDERRRLARK